MQKGFRRGGISLRKVKQFNFRCVRIDGGSAFCAEDVCFPNPCLNNASCTANDVTTYIIEDDCQGIDLFIIRSICLSIIRGQIFIADKKS